MTIYSLPGVWDQHLQFDTELLNEEPALREAFANARRVRAGFGHRVHVDLTPADAKRLADHVELKVELEQQIAGGAGDGAEYALIRTGPKLIEKLRETGGSP